MGRTRCIVVLPDKLQSRQVGGHALWKRDYTCVERLAWGKDSESGRERLGSVESVCLYIWSAFFRQWGSLITCALHSFPWNRTRGCLIGCCVGYRKENKQISEAVVDARFGRLISVTLAAGVKILSSLALHLRLYVLTLSTCLTSHRVIRLCKLFLSPVHS